VLGSHGGIRRLVVLDGFFVATTQRGILHAAHP
jgi:hypothetical protein